MKQLIDALSPKERAILFQALHHYDYDATLLLAQVKQQGPSINVKPLLWLSNETAALKKKLFSECFPEDLEPLDYFLKDQKELQNREFHITANGLSVDGSNKVAVPECYIKAETFLEASNKLTKFLETEILTPDIRLITPMDLINFS